VGKEPLIWDERGYHYHLSQGSHVKRTNVKRRQAAMAPLLHGINPNYYYYYY